jgi:hypothetical protein
MANSTRYKYDAFISYSHKDRDWVRNVLLPTLELHKLRVMIDFRNFEAGAPSITEMERAVKQSRKTILVLTPNYVNSSWSEFEAVLAGTLDPAGRERRILPILLEKCNLPLRLSYLTYLDFSNPATLDLQWKKLIRAFNKKTSPPPTVAVGTPPSSINPGISSVDLPKVRKVLLDCDELSTNALLRAIFSDPRLSTFKSGLPEASSLSERVDLLTAFLISRKFSSGESLLTVFLKVLCEKIPAGDARIQDLEEVMKVL